MRRTLLVPAAGRGTRLGSFCPKVLTPVGGRTMLEWLLDRYRPYCASVVLVIRPSDREVIDAAIRTLPDDIACAEQAEPTGMLDAILAGAASATATSPDRVWITWCDQILISTTTAERLAALDEADAPPAAILPTSRQQPPYIHFDRSPDGALIGVRQRREGDAMPAAGESDAGLFSLSHHALAVDLPAFAEHAPRGERTGERNFLPFFPWLAARGSVATFEIPAIESLGVNTPEDLAAAARHLNRAAAD